MQRNLGRACGLAVTGRLLALTTILTGAIFVLFASARAEDDHEDGHFVQTNLVSDLGGVAAVTDPMLKNPWGLSHTPVSPFWSSNQGTSTATLYAVTNKTTVAKVNINPPAGDVLIRPHPWRGHRDRLAKSATATLHPSQSITAATEGLHISSLPI